MTQLDKVSPSDILTLVSKYPQIDRSLREVVAAKYIARVRKEQESGPQGFYSAYKFMKEVRGSPLGKDVKFETIRIADISADSDNKFFALSLNNDTRLPLSKRAAQGLLENSELQDAEYIIAITTRPNEPKRKVTDKSEVTSKFQSGQRTLPNPAYQQAQANYVNAEQELNRQNLQNSVTPAYGWAAVFRGAAQGIQAAVKQKYFDELQSTSATIDEPVYTDYSFRVTKVETIKSGDLLLTVLDRKGQTISKFTSPWEERKTFDIAYGIHEKDPDKYRLGSSYVEEKSIDSFEQGSQTVLLSGVLEKLIAAAPQFSRYTASDPLFDQTVVAASASLPSAAGKSFEPNANIAALLDSVVIVRNPSGGTGAGFYIAPDLILTNQHVIEGAKFAEVKLHSGVESIGRVIKTDIGLDLALVKVADRGVPVIFQTTPFTAGSTVEAIGHPKGLTFSVTRGIVSAVRKMKNPLVRGSREMLVVQTDAAINPGNSGGPLFLDGKVIGINSQKLSAAGIEGIGFAVHFVEIGRFLNE